MKFLAIILVVMATSVNAIGESSNSTVVTASTRAPTLAPKNVSTSFSAPNKVVHFNKTATPAVTEAPTDSPAPSPSPSATPSSNPTGTIGPTNNPSIIPTDSPAPSPSPSNSPSSKPSTSPSISPSMNPSKSPSDMPSEIPSNVPSGSPSISPTISPSLGPSISGAPSMTPSVSSFPTSPTATPSTNPTIIPSSRPSVPPTLSPSVAMIVQSTRDAVTLDIHGKDMTRDVIAVFEQQTQEFLQTQVNSDGYYPKFNITILSVNVTEQTIIPARRLSTGRSLHQDGLRIRFEVTGEVRPGSPPDDFLFSYAIGKPLQDDFLMFTYRLSAANPFFNPILDDKKNDESSALAAEGSRNASGHKLGSGAFVGIIVSVLGAVMLAIVAAVYAVRGRNRESDSVSGARIDICALENCDSHSTAMTPYGVPDSPGSLESGFHPVSMGIVHNIAEVTDMAKTRSLLDSMVNHSASSDTEEPDLGTKLSSDVLAAHGSCLNGRDPPACTLPVISLQVPTMGSSFCYSDDGTPKSVELTPVSVIVSPAVRRAAEGANQKMSVLGARPMGDTEKQQFQQLSSYECSTVKRSGLYDVFAPPGPLGIVVDTTRDGPVIHSMKPTSPLLGLICPGDLIVGLDDIDTRSMTAATLTRAMAKQSHEPERKITLLAVENNK